MKDLVLNKTLYFPKVVYHTVLDEEICNQVNGLANKEKSNWKKDLNNVKAITSGWHSFHYPILNDLSQFICSKILPSVSPHQKWKTKHVWVNVYSRGDKAKPHDHIGVDMCAVLLTTKTTKNCLKFMENNMLEQVNEQKGLLIIFPPELVHLVEEVEDQQRITVAFNFLKDA